jgi:hypothetical protein
MDNVLRNVVEDALGPIKVSSSGIYIHETRDAYAVRFRTPCFEECIIDNEIVEAGNHDKIARLVRESISKLHAQLAAWLKENQVP